MSSCCLPLAMVLLASTWIPAADPPPPIRSMSFNIRCSTARDGADAWVARRAFLVDTIRASDPDLLGLQEVVHDQSEFIRVSLPGMTLVGGGRDDGKAKGEASPILFRASRFELIASGQFWLSETPDVVGTRGWDAALPRICTFAELRDRSAATTIICMNTHWDHKGARARDESAKLMRARALALVGDNPALITGDFNIDEDAEAYRTLLGTDAAGVRFTDCYRSVHPARSADEATFHGFTGATKGSRIDWILASPHLIARSADIVHTAKDGHYPSDHFPVTAELSYR